MGAPFVLLVDDEVPFVETMEKRLTKRNYIVITANDGQEALDVLEKNKNIDVIILDVKMPRLDGIETLKEIKKRLPLAEVLMLTGHATVETAIDGMKLGAYDYLMKPCDIEQLVSKIDEAAAKKKDHEIRIRDARTREILSDRHW